jgi:hypothetical protein
MDLALLVAWRFKKNQVLDILVGVGQNMSVPGPIMTLHGLWLRPAAMAKWLMSREPPFMNVSSLPVLSFVEEVEGGSTRSPF